MAKEKKSVESTSPQEHGDIVWSGESDGNSASDAKSQSDEGKKEAGEVAAQTTKKKAGKEAEAKTQVVAAVSDEASEKMVANKVVKKVTAKKIAAKKVIEKEVVKKTVAKKTIAKKAVKKTVAKKIAAKKVAKKTVAKKATKKIVKKSVAKKITKKAAKKIVAKKVIKKTATKRVVSQAIEPSVKEIMTQKVTENRATAERKSVPSPVVAKDGPATKSRQEEKLSKADLQPTENNDWTIEDLSQNARHLAPVRAMAAEREIDAAVMHTEYIEEDGDTYSYQGWLNSDRFWKRTMASFGYMSVGGVFVGVPFFVLMITVTFVARGFMG